ncbi:MAG: hypothetical protein GXO25_04160, partial [Euryarchaeota archaeon]|nr:hypothetical protein [Euryarchaeota archaeon]
NGYEYLDIFTKSGTSYMEVPAKVNYEERCIRIFEVEEQREIYIPFENILAWRTQRGHIDAQALKVNLGIGTEEAEAIA